MRAISHREAVLKRPVVIIGAAVVCVITFVVYFAMRPPEGVTPMGEEGSATVAWISLAVALLSLATAAVGLIQKVVELRAAKRG
jgi:hypothetical protein